MAIVVESTVSAALDRVVGDLQELLHDKQDGMAARVRRWIAHVLVDAQGRRKWWFLEKRTSAALALGADVVDLRGDVDKVVGLWAPDRLAVASLARLTEWRAAAASSANAGTVTHYALEFLGPGRGVRLHLWPAPAAAVTLTVLYTRPMDLAALPPAWETLVVNGVLGRYGRHFDRDQLSQDPVEFERRYEVQLKQAAIAHHDLERVERYDAAEPASTVTTQSGAGTATEHVVPASLTGIGYVTVETGDYPLEVA